MKKTTVIFDMDGVVIDSERLYDIADAEFLMRRGVAFDKDKIVPLIAGKSLIESTAMLQALYGFDGDVGALRDERRNFVEELYRGSLKFIDGFAEFHDGLLRQGIATCVATASDDKLIALVDQKLGLSKIFGEKKIFKISDVGDKSKPDPAIFLYAAAQMKVLPAECIVIEDAPHGVAAAKNAGMYCVALTTTRPREELTRADVIVDSYVDINSLMLSL